VKIVAVPETFRNYDLVGKIILSVDNQEVNNIDQAQTLFKNISRYGKTVLTMIDENGERERLIFQ